MSALPTQAPPGGVKRQASAGRRAAEWVTLAISALLLMSLSGYLLRHALNPGTPYVLARARVLLEHARQQEGTFILPVEIHNPGRHTLKDLKVEVQYRSVEGEDETQELEIDYLGEQSRQTVYLYFDSHPRDLQVKARPVQYRLD